MLLYTLLLSLFFFAPAEAAAWPELSQKIDNAIKERTSDKALIVSIGNYDQVSDIKGAQKNGQDWYLWLTESHGLNPRSVHLLLDGQATREEIIGAAEELGSKSKAGERIWFVFIGHGAPSRDGSEGLLLGADVRQTAKSIYARGVAQSEIFDVLGRNGSDVIAVIDSCFSGKTDQGSALVPNLQPLVASKARAPRGSTTVLTAGRSNQFAGPLPGAERPAFSYLALGALRGWGDLDRNSLVTAQEIVDYSKGTLEALAVSIGRKQSPEGQGRNLLLPLSRAVETGPSVGRIRLSLGSSAAVKTSPPPAKNAPAALPAKAVTKGSGNPALSPVQRKQQSVVEAYERERESYMQAIQNKERFYATVKNDLQKPQGKLERQGRRYVDEAGRIWTEKSLLSASMDMGCQRLRNNPPTGFYYGFGGFLMAASITGYVQSLNLEDPEEVKKGRILAAGLGIPGIGLVFGGAVRPGKVRKCILGSK